MLVDHKAFYRGMPLFTLYLYAMPALFDFLAPRYGFAMASIMVPTLLNPISLLCRQLIYTVDYEVVFNQVLQKSIREGKGQPRKEFFGAASGSPSLRDLAVKIYNEKGFRGYFRGNCLSILALTLFNVKTMIHY